MNNLERLICAYIHDNETRTINAFFCCSTRSVLDFEYLYNKSMDEVSALSEPTELILSRSSSNQQDYKRHCLSWLSCNMMRLSSNMN